MKLSLIAILFFFFPPKPLHKILKNLFQLFETNYDTKNKTRKIQLN